MCSYKFTLWTETSIKFDLSSTYFAQSHSYRLKTSGTTLAVMQTDIARPPHCAVTTFTSCKEYVQTRG
jgi:hypothetical protein